MSAETMQQMFELFAKLGEQGQYAFFAWLAFRALDAAIISGTIITVILLIVKSVARYHNAESTLREVGKVVGVRFWEPDNDDCLKVIEAVRNLTAR